MQALVVPWEGAPNNAACLAFNANDLTNCTYANVCTVNDHCESNGSCVGTPDDFATCDDGNLCTDTACSGGVCVVTCTTTCTDPDTRLYNLYLNQFTGNPVTGDCDPVF